MLGIKKEQIKFISWQVTEGSSNWGRMQFEVRGVSLEPIKKPMLSVYNLKGKSIIDVECFILNNVSESMLLESSLDSIIESVLSVINDEDIIIQDASVLDSGLGVSSDFYSNSINDDFSGGYGEYFIDDEEYEEEEVVFESEEDEYSNGDFSVDVTIKDVNGLDYYDDMGYDDYDDEEDEDDDF